MDSPRPPRWGTIRSSRCEGAVRRAAIPSASEQATRACERPYTAFGLPPTAVRIAAQRLACLLVRSGCCARGGFLARQDGTVPRAVLGHLGGFHARLEPGTCLPTGIPFPATEWHRCAFEGWGATRTSSFVVDRTRSGIMAGWRQAVALAMTGEEIEALTALSRSRTEPAGRVSRAAMLLGLCRGTKTWRASSDGAALRRASDGLWRACGT